jgi:hypothetical protein
MIAGAPVKHVPQPVRIEKLQSGVWRETYADGRQVIVTDLTSALWRWKPMAHPVSLRRK